MPLRCWSFCCCLYFLLGVVLLREGVLEAASGNGIAFAAAMLAALQLPCWAVEVDGVVAACNAAVGL